jgi:hypothetical protein
MNKRTPTHLIVTQTAAWPQTTTDRMTLAEFEARFPALAEQARATLKDGATRGEGGIYIARGAGNVG